MALLVTILLLLLQTIPQQQLQTQSGKAMIEGFVVRVGTNEPIPRARITAVRTAGPGGAPIPQSGPPQNIPPVIADSQGHFIIKDLEPGSYLLNAQRNGFARQAYGERAPGRAGSPLNMIAGQTLADVIFRLVPGGTITGRVTDATGETLAGITIQALRSIYDQNGKRTFQMINSARTNDRGEYRIYWVTPGRYYVSAGPNASPFGFSPILPNSNEVVEPGYVLTFYPGTTAPSMAAALEVQPGVELSTIDFILAQQQLFRVRGRVFDARTGQFPRNANISIYPRNPNAGFINSSSFASYSPATGTFELRDVPAGSYWVRANALNPGPGPITAGDIARNSAQVAIEVANTDVENVVLAFTSGFSIKGRVDLEEAPLSTLSDTERMRVFLAPLEPMQLSPAPQQVKTDGSFTFDSVQTGDYRVNIISMPPNTFIKSALLGQTDVSSGVSLAGPVSDSLEILVSTKVAQIDGVIVDKDQKTVRGIQALLIPDRRERRDLYKFATSDQNGQFMLRGVAPGDYKLFAWDDIEPGEYNDPDFLRRYEAFAAPVKLSESSRLTVEMKLIPKN